MRGELQLGEGKKDLRSQFTRTTTVKSSTHFIPGLEGHL